MTPWYARRSGFTLLELLVGIGILVVLAGILAPKVARMREVERRTRCTDNLRKLGWAMSQYGKDSRDELPRVIYDQAHHPRSFTAFTGPDALSPFTADSTVAPNDMTASLWLLIRGGYISSEYVPASAVFICPSSGDAPDPMLDDQGKPVGASRRSNFRSPTNLSYSYASPFSDAPRYGLKADFLMKDFVLLADRNAGRTGPSQDVTLPSPDDPPMKLRVGNSRNHGQAGQNVLYGDMHVEFRTTPYCGVDDDNIYTAQSREQNVSGEAPPARVPGYLGIDIGPAWPTDSYLVPAEEY